MIFGIDYSLYFVCSVGAFVLYFTLQQKGKSTFEILGTINPKWKESAWCRFFEAIIFTILGAFIATIITQPANPQQAIAAGLGWTGLLNGIKR